METLTLVEKQINRFKQQFLGSSDFGVINKIFKKQYDITY